MQGFENGVIQMESIIIVAVLFVFLACAAVICMVITTGKILNSLAGSKSILTVEGKTVPPKLRHVGLFARSINKLKRKADIEPSKQEAASDGGEQTGELLGLETLKLDYSDEWKPDADDLNANEPDEVDTNAFDEAFMCEDDSYEYYGDTIDIEKVG